MNRLDKDACRHACVAKIPKPPATDKRWVNWLCDAWDLYFILGTNQYRYAFDKLRQNLKTEWLKTETDWETIAGWNFFPITVLHTNCGKGTGTSETKSTGKAEWIDSINCGKNTKPLLPRYRDVKPTLSSVFVARGLKLFLVPNHFFDGGVTGVSLIYMKYITSTLGRMILLFESSLMRVFYRRKEIRFIVLWSIWLDGSGAFVYCWFSRLCTLRQIHPLTYAIFGGVFPPGIGIGLDHCGRQVLLSLDGGIEAVGGLIH